MSDMNRDRLVIQSSEGMYFIEIIIDRSICKQETTDRSYVNKYKGTII